MNRLGLHAWVSGRVQGVWFRQSTKEQADGNGVDGWVRNLPDGRVEVMMSGDANAVRLLEAWLSQGPPLANVADVEVEEVEPDPALQGFEVR
ncbi:acylphosphatase [Motiliproteus sp. SC1-56]|uniref:acylphosphatase n=1 Tax=Motiliproteus sp. SC1-56 TaxID=2799565 RepID=UPI001A90824B|nr:acylphosphatase [Motiliproteus sp. SC1-56]